MRRKHVVPRAVGSFGDAGRILRRANCAIGDQADLATGDSTDLAASPDAGSHATPFSGDDGHAAACRHGGRSDGTRSGH